MKPFEYIGLCLTKLFSIKNNMSRTSSTLSLIPQFEFLGFQLDRLVEEVDAVIGVFEKEAKIERKEQRPFAEEKFSDEHMYLIKSRGNLIDAAREVAEMSGELKIIGKLNSTEKYNVFTNSLDNLLRAIAGVIVDFDEANTNKMKESDYLPLAQELEHQTQIEKEKNKKIDEKQLALRSNQIGDTEGDEEESESSGLSQTPRGVTTMSPVKPVKQLKKKQPKAENKMNIESLIALADKLDKAGQEEEANRIDEMVKKIAAELPPIDIKKVNFDEVEDKEQKTLKENKIGNTSAAFEKLAAIADKLDEIGAPEEAGLIDEFLQKYASSPEDKYVLKGTEDEITSAVSVFVNSPGEETKNKAVESLQKYLDLHESYTNLNPKSAAKKTETADPYDSKEHRKTQVRQPKKENKETKDHHVSSYQSGNSTLSIRHCPVHIGVPMSRIGDHTYQCSLDGEVFNWETGWTGPDGEVHPGGSVAAQTPESTEYETSHRIFDSREKTLSGATY